MDDTISPDLTEPDPASYIGGDPVMAAIGTGHDYAETVQTQQEIDAAEKAKGAPLTDAETTAILTKHPSADTGLATGPQTTRAVGRWIADLPSKILKATWWIWAILALLIIIVVMILLAPYAKFIPTREG